MSGKWPISDASILVEYDTMEKLFTHPLIAMKNQDSSAMNTLWLSTMSTSAPGKRWTTGHTALWIIYLIFDDEVDRSIDTWTMSIKVKIKSQTFDLFDPILMFSFLSAFELTCEANSVRERGARFGCCTFSQIVPPLLYLTHAEHSNCSCTSVKMRAQ